MNTQEQFAYNVVDVVRDNDNVVGLAVAGSWITSEIDEFSDLDLILITREKISNDKSKMLDYARQFGQLLSAFTGEHVGEPRVLICLYDEPLLHVDIKFLVVDELRERIEDPVILLDKGGELKNIVDDSLPEFPYPDYQWIEDRFWTWVHYSLLKIGRGEYVEAFDFLGFLRMVVFGPLLHIRNGNLPRGVRKLESGLVKEDLEQLEKTLPSYSRGALLESLKYSVALYRRLRNELFASEVIVRSGAEERVMQYFQLVEQERIG